MQLLLYYLLIVNALGILLMLVDKSRARKKLRRISETNLYFVAISGGALGELLGMYLVRHKTRHKKFTIGLPIMTALHIVLLVRLILF